MLKPPAVLISDTTGILGAATPTGKGVKFTCLIIPGLKPGRLADVRSHFLDTGSGRAKEKRSTDAGGRLFRIATIAYSGSSREDEFHADLARRRHHLPRPRRCPGTEHGPNLRSWTATARTIEETKRLSFAAAAVFRIGSRLRATWGGARTREGGFAVSNRSPSTAG